jgi:aspartate kinase
VPDARRLASLRHEEMLEMAEAGAGVLQPRSVELAAAHGVDIHLRSSFSAEPGTWIRRETAGSGFESAGEASGTSDVAGVAHRRQESLYAVPGAGVGAVVGALAERGITTGAVVPDDAGIRFTAPGADPAEVAAALAGLGVQATVDEELGSVAVVSLGMARKPDVPVRALTLLEEAGIAPRLVTTTPNRVTALVPASEVDDAVRLLHSAFVPAPVAGTVTDLRTPADAA